jgi:hypothetical protein
MAEKRYSVATLLSHSHPSGISFDRLRFADAC